jgi:hypothetical protein
MIKIQKKTFIKGDKETDMYRARKEERRKEERSNSHKGPKMGVDGVCIFPRTEVVVATPL